MPSDQYPGGPYGAPGPYGGMPPVVGTNGKAKAAMILGICGLLCGICGILGIIFGFIAKNEIKQSGQRGDGMATAGIVLGFAWIVLDIIVYAATR